MTTDEAHRIAQDFLDRQGEATIAADLEATLDCCDIPCTLESMEGRVVVTTPEQMRGVCVAFIDQLKAQRFTHMVRTCVEAKFKDPDTLWATYETRYIRDHAQLIGQPYLGFVILQRREDRWKISMMQFVVSGQSPANTALKDWLQRKSDG